MNGRLAALGVVALIALAFRGPAAVIGVALFIIGLSGFYTVASL